MKERPILFSAPMVRALLAGTKTQTRRAFKTKNGGVWPNANDLPGMRQILRSCPYGQPGDRLWVRETWQGPLLQEFEIDADPDWHYASHLHQYQNPEHCEYAADGGPKPEYTDADDVMRQGWRASIHMPRWASRITLEITGVRVERLLDIREADCIAEGTPGGHGSIPGYHYNATPDEHYRWLWESINGPGSWAANPWVWVLEFRRLQEGGAA